ncbi:P-loop containing nucleoside triphosphate hydrolase protein [Dactylonectria macrodidyma]|uniref:Adenylosuccinate synthetase n=1 Tax=Dactylonectria macrodidyma TaxID=307937 RepID=A0A9P9JJZ8_9HYPO|nr:P-loop containing nucleoside triphosphate hydrolase protein [Dactylonectria macrodidyma]
MLASVVPIANGVSYSFHLLPSGFINLICMNFIGSGVVFHVPRAVRPLASWSVLPSSRNSRSLTKGLHNVYERILVSDREHIDFDLHSAVDGLEEVELGERKVGTTGKGIGPAYSTKTARSGILLAEVIDEELFVSKLRRLAAGFAERYGDLLKYDVEDEIARFKEYRPKLAKHAVDAVAFMQSAQQSNTKILIEGANALMLDLDWGTFPYVTSSSTCLGGCISGLALNPRKITEVIGVVKAYTTRVGYGAFPTESTTEDVGAINYYTAWNLTKLDVLDTFPTLKIAIAYKDPETGEVYSFFPFRLKLLERAEVVYHEMPGWNKPTTNAKTYYDLPIQTRNYIEYIEEFIGVKVKYIGTGPSRDAMIKRF